MLSIVWAILIISSLIFAIFTNNISEVTSSITIGAKEAISLCISITGIMCFWSGIMEILIKSGLTKKISKALMPILKLIFKDTYKDREAMEYVSSNITANLLGLSNAATPMGLKAADKIHGGKSYLSHDLIMLVVINCSSIQLIPTTVAAVRSMYGSSTPFDILPAVIITSVLSVLSGIIVAKICAKFYKG